MIYIINVLRIISQIIIFIPAFCVALIWSLMYWDDRYVDKALEYICDVVNNEK